MVISKSQIFLSFVSLCLPVVLSGHLYIQPSETFRTFFTGGEFFITCVADTESADRLVWRTPSGEITDTEGRIHVEAQDREEDRVLTLFVNGVRLGDDGDYTCATNRDDENSITVKITVFRAISFTGSPEEHVASEGDDSTTILCNVIATPEPIVSWIFNRSKIDSGGRYKVNKGGLTISNVTRYDVGFYVCRAIVITTETSLIKSHRIKLLVQYPPSFTETESELNSDLDADLLLSRATFSALHSTASLVCKAEGYPTPNYQWLRDGILVEELTYDSIVVVYNVTSYDDKSVLNVSLQDVDLLGDYTCRVSNPLGLQEKTLTIKEGDPPGIPSVTLKHADNNSAYFALTISKHASGRKKNQRRNPLRVTGYLLQIRTSIGQVNGLSPIDWDSADQLEFKEGEDLIVRNLTSDTGYVVRVAAKNVAGYGQFSTEIRFNMYSKNDNDHLVVSDQGAVTGGSQPNGNAKMSVNFNLVLAASLLVFVSRKSSRESRFR